MTEDELRDLLDMMFLPSEDLELGKVLLRERLSLVQDLLSTMQGSHGGINSSMLGLWAGLLKRSGFKGWATPRWLLEVREAWYALEQHETRALDILKEQIQ